MKESNRIENEEKFIEFCVECDLKPSTINNYKNGLQKYSDFTEKTLEELIREAEDEEDDRIRLKRRKINKYLRDFKLSLRESNLSEGTIELIIIQVIALYGHNEIELPRNDRKSIGNTQRQETIVQLIEQLKAKGNFIPTGDIIGIKRNFPYTTY